MAFDGIVTRAMARELTQRLDRGRIEKIHQPDKTELVFTVRHFKDREKLYLSANSDRCGAFLSDEEYPNPTSPSGLCMLLRKHLQGGTVEFVRQKDSERILEIGVSSRSELGDMVLYLVICEIMGKHSNIVLVESDTMRILDAVKRISLDVNRARQILPGLTYQYPPAQDKVPFEEVTAESLSAMLEAHKENAPFEQRESYKTVLDLVGGISPAVARELTKESEGTPDLGKVADSMKELLYKADNDPRPTVYLKEDGTPKDFHVVPLAALEEVYNKKEFDDLSSAIGYYYANRDTSNRIKQKSQDLSRHTAGLLKKLYLKKKRLGEDLLEAENSEHFRLYGELLNANLHLFHTGDKEVTVTNYYTGEPVTIPLDIRYAPAKNAQLYFKKYSKAKNAVREKQAQLETADQDIRYLESIQDLIERASGIEDLDAIRQELIDTGYLRPRKASQRKGKGGKKDLPSPYHYTTSAGLDVLAGHNNKENDHITLKVAGKNDLWFHTKDIPGSHVILFCKNKEPDDKSIYEAAQIAAFHSKGRNSDNVPVDYTKVRYVKKPNGAKPGMVIFTDNHTVYVTPKLP